MGPDEIQKERQIAELWRKGISSTRQTLSILSKLRQLMSKDQYTNYLKTIKEMEIDYV